MGSVLLYCCVSTPPGLARQRPEAQKIPLQQKVVYGRVSVVLFAMSESSFPLQHKKL
jgi:hypothetical protein